MKANPNWKGIKGSWLISGRRTYFDKFINLITRGEGQFPFYFYDYQIKANIDLNIDHRLTYTRFYGDDIWMFLLQIRLMMNLVLLNQSLVLMALG
ncbi:MAG: hypothetical protein Ct9H300mP18_09030 [Candidatus Neomarinimicrobiota bacterium]|nr:MAG: hypothetical protein Ct9H300mP18_09030 [Candidatus Neomarinimicrobiota bacterium]